MVVNCMPHKDRPHPLEAAAPSRLDVNTVISIMLTADGGCGVCVRDLLKQLGGDYPKHRSRINRAYEREFNDTITWED